MRAVTAFWRYICQEYDYTIMDIMKNALLKPDVILQKEANDAPLAFN